MITAGIDAGSRMIKVVLLDAASGRIVGSGRCDQGVRQETDARRLFDKVLEDSGVRHEDVQAIVATGYARKALRFADRALTEISCHAAGVHKLVPAARSVVEIGGQDSKVLILDGEGAVEDFFMNDRCAAGTGRFLEMVAERLEAPLDRFGPLAEAAENALSISSTCAVFAETEIVGLLASGTAREDIARGVQAAVAGRIASLAGRDLPNPVVFTGGVAAVTGMKTALETALARSVRICPDPFLSGALGAAILAAAND